MILRQSRKLEHIVQALRLYDRDTHRALWQDVGLIHECLPELDFDAVDLNTMFLGKKIAAPIMINALTGGSDDVSGYNEKLAVLARELNIPMAVGSQYAAVENSQVRHTFEVVRELNPQGVLLGNIGAHASVEQAQIAVGMIDADALQIHINPAQEMIMQEGDRNFKGYLNNIKKIKEGLQVPVIAKETGCGMSFESMERLLAVGVEHIDVSGAGGTNFLAIENARKNGVLYQELSEWGIPTAASLLMGAVVVPHSGSLIASGGINTPMQVVQALALGSDMVGMSIYFLELVHNRDDMDLAVAEVRDFLREVKTIMLLCGVGKPQELRTKRVHITGQLRNWVETYGVPMDKIARKRRC